MTPTIEEAVIALELVIEQRDLWERALEDTGNLQAAYMAAQWRDAALWLMNRALLQTPAHSAPGIPELCDGLLQAAMSSHVRAHAQARVTRRCAQFRDDPIAQSVLNGYRVILEYSESADRHLRPGRSYDSIRAFERALYRAQSHTVGAERVAYCIYTTDGKIRLQAEHHLARYRAIDIGAELLGMLAKRLETSADEEALKRAKGLRVAVTVMADDLEGYAP
jgi:hypothetical protein